MKVAMLSTFYPFRGGIAQFNASLFRALERQHEVKAYNFKRQYPDLLFPGKTQYVSGQDAADVIPNERMLDSINPLSWMKTGRKIAEWEPDVLVEKFWMSFFGPSLGTVNWRLRKKPAATLAILDNVIPHEQRFIDRPFTKFFLNQTDGFVVMSETVKKDLLSLKPDANYRVHPHPIYSHFGEPVAKEEAREQLEVPQGKKVLLFFGLIRDYKGLDILLNALDMLPEDYHLLIAGESYGDFGQYRDIIDSKKLHDRVTLLVRYIDDEEVPLLFSAADTCVLPYRSATQSGIMYIAFHFRLPLIVTDVGSLADMTRQYQAGLVVERADSTLISDAIKNYFTENLAPHFREQMKQFNKEYNWDTLAELITDFGEELKQAKQV